MSSPKLHPLTRGPLHRWIVALALAFLLGAASGLRAEETVQLTPRPGVSETLLVIAVDRAPAALLLLPGGNGVLSGLRYNFLVRTRQDFATTGLGVGVLDAPTDHYGMDASYRASAEHGQDIAAAVALLAARTHAPVWLVGTSNGTISAVNGAVRLGPIRVAGVVLTSSVWSGGVSNVPLAEIAVPVLLVHNREDGCPSSPFTAAATALDSLAKAPAKELIAVSSHETRSRPCEGLAPHGYLGIEGEVVGKIAAWVKAHSAPR